MLSAAGRPLATNAISTVGHGAQVRSASRGLLNFAGTRGFGDTKESKGIAPVASETYAGVGARCPSRKATAVGSLLLFAQSRSGRLHPFPPDLDVAWIAGKETRRRLSGALAGNHE
jgi:hypothetical protein